MSDITELSAPFVSETPDLKIDPTTGLWILPEGQEWRIAKRKRFTDLQIVETITENGEPHETVIYAYNIDDVDLHGRPLMKLMHDIAYEMRMQEIIFCDNARITNLLTVK